MSALAHIIPWLILSAAGAAAVSFGQSVSPKTASTSASVAIAEYQLPKAEYVGAATCASASCHGGPVNQRGGEYSTWSAGDPHVRAFAVLFNELSRQIVSRLGGDMPAHQNILCLKCHAETTGHGTKAASSRLGCESCHGPAEHYLTTHFQSSFASLSLNEKASHGLYPTKDLLFRIRLCASCHVGDATREVNHDLIAAGHPRLMFEYNSYHHHPKNAVHWQEKAPDFEVRSWVLGQIISARTSVELLRSRADSAVKSRSPWPELAEYNCSACHAPLSTERNQSKPIEGTQRNAGLMRWGTWTTPLLPAMPGAEPTTLKEIDKLKEMMERAKQLPPADISKQCTVVLGLLDNWLKREQTAPFEARKIAQSLASHALSADRKHLNNLDWDSLVQHYLGLAALNYASPNGGEHTPLLQIRKGLAYPMGLNSPPKIGMGDLLKQFERLAESSEERSQQR